MTSSNVDSPVVFVICYSSVLILFCVSRPKYSNFKHILISSVTTFISAKMLNIKKYGSSSEDESDSDEETSQIHSNEALLTHLKPVAPDLSLAKKMQICAAPAVVPTVIN